LICARAPSEFCALVDRAAGRLQEGARLAPPALYSDSNGEYTRDCVSAEDADVPAYHVFARRDGKIRHFWSEEMGPPPIPAKTRAALPT